MHIWTCYQDVTAGWSKEIWILWACQCELFSSESNNQKYKVAL